VRLEPDPLADAFVPVRIRLGAQVHSAPVHSVDQDFVRLAGERTVPERHFELLR
jgi:hypothetical protein